MWRDIRGTAVAEMAIVLPVLLALILGIISYGDWFYVAHNVQQAANNSARSAVGGLTSTERLQMALATAKSDMMRSGNLDFKNATLNIDDDGTSLTVHVRYDASSDPLLHLSFVNTPSSIIERAASVRLDSL